MIQVVMLRRTPKHLLARSDPSLRTGWRACCVENDSQNMRRLIEKIRNSDEATKQRWTVGLTIASSALVAALWMGYVAVEIPAIPQPKARLAALGARPIAITEKKEVKPGITEVFAAGASEVTATVGRRLSRGVAMVKALFATPNTFEVRAAKQNFILEGVEAVPETSFP